MKNQFEFGGDLTPARLHGLRHFVKETIHGLAEKTGLPIKYIAEIELGKTNPPVMHVKALLDAMGIQAESYHMHRCAFEEKRFI